MFLEVLEDLDGAIRLAHRVHGRLVAPDKLLGGAETLIPERHRSVDDVLPVSAHHHEPSKGNKHQWVEFVCVKV